MEKIKIETRVFVDGTSIENMNELRMTNLFEKSGYSGIFFDNVRFLKIKNDIAYFKYLNRSDDIAVGYILLDLKKGEVEFDCDCSSFDIETENQKAMDFYYSIDGSKI